MDARRLWVTMAFFGVVASLMTSLGLIAFVVLVVATVPLIIRGRALALSGLLTGFGASWTS